MVAGRIGLEWVPDVFQVILELKMGIFDENRGFSPTLTPFLSTWRPSISILPVDRALIHRIIVT